MVALSGDTVIDWGVCADAQHDIATAQSRKSWV
jgi:hypothetical protein